MKYALLLLALVACGSDNTLEVSGEVTVTHRIELAIEYFDEYCKLKYPNSEIEKADCVNDNLMKFMELLAKIGG
jgi:hypothetical protein